MEWTIKKLRRVAVIVMGFTVLAIGVAMVVLPGPAIMVIPVGLGILATEFAWARHLLHKIRGVSDSIRSSRTAKAQKASSPENP